MSTSGFGGVHAVPHYAVIFSSQRTPGDGGYGDMAGRMGQLCEGQPGFLGIESARDPSGFGITVCYWRSLEDIAAWKAHSEHRLAQALGIERWYEHYELRVAQVLKAYAMHPAGGAPGAPGAPAAPAAPAADDQPSASSR